MSIKDMLEKSKKEKIRAKKIDTAKKVGVGLGIGAAIGTALGILTAPKSGKETRQDIANAAKKTADNIKDSAADIKDKVASVVEESKEKIAEILEEGKEKFGKGKKEAAAANDEPCCKDEECNDIKCGCCCDEEE